MMARRHYPHRTSTQNVTRDQQPLWGETPDVSCLLRLSIYTAVASVYAFVNPFHTPRIVALSMTT